MVSNENGQHGNGPVRTDSPSGRRGFDLFRTLLAITGLRAVSSVLARVGGRDARGTGGSDEETREEPVGAYCLKCRKTVNMADRTEVTMTNGTSAAKGTCPECSSDVFRILAR